MAGDTQGQSRIQSSVNQVDLEARLQTSITAHSKISGVIADVLSQSFGSTEVAVRDRLQAAIAKLPEMHASGWYSPPPAGIGVLFAGPDNRERSRFSSLRLEENWPKADYIFERETVGIVYVSPVDRASGAIADFGLTIYCGTDQKIQAHLRRCLEATETIAEQVTVGMQFREVYDLGERLLKQQGLHNDLMVTINDPLRGADYGHTWPWSYQLPTEAEQAIIDRGDLAAASELITHSRVYLNAAEEFKIPETIAFSIEPHIGSSEDPDLPAGYFYALVVFRAGERSIFTNINPILDALDITYMRSRF